MVSLAQIDNKLQNSFLNIKKDMDSFRNTLETQNERIKELEREVNSLPGYKELEKLKEGLNEARVISKRQSNETMNIIGKIQNLRDDFVLKEELENLKPKGFEEEIDALNEKLSGLIKKLDSKKGIEELSSELKEIKKELEKKTKEPEKPKEEKKKKEKKPEEPKEEVKEEEEKPKKKIFDKVIDFFAEEE